ncbi:MAG: hypothetical protein K2P39_00725 [Lachnospiraceae bacterium]|nr:hypothetical protein [Lachnospiraceae bacterium]
MRRGTVLWAALTGSALLMMQGCAVRDDLGLPYFDRGDEKTAVEETKDPEDTDETRAYEPEQPRADETAAAPNTQAEEQSVREVSELYYAYHQLDGEKQKLYLEMLDAMTGMKSGVLLSTVDKSVLDVVFACVMNDHPELFYVDGYQYTEYTLGDVTTGITFSGTYSMASAEVEQTKLSIDQKMAECLAQAPRDGDEYSTVRYLYEWLIENTEYDKNAANNQNISSVFLQGRSVCQGYAKAMQYMLQSEGIQCLLVTGFTNGERHGWNLVRVNDAYYYLDPTWGDASYASSGTEDAAESFAPAINYDYFLVTTDEITRTHAIEKAVELPQCTALADNYFVREGLYFDSYDEAKLAAVFAGETVKEAGYVTIKCGDSATYEQMVQNLIGSQKIFDFVDKLGESIAYTCNEEQRTVSFWNL